MTGSARFFAASAIAAVLGEGKPLDLTLHRFFVQATHLEPRDRAFASQIAIGTVRHYGLLTFLLSRVMERGPLPEKHHFAWAVLTSALYQVRFLSVPDRAAVHEGVTLIKESRDAHLAGFANAVLKRAALLDPAALLAEIPDPLMRIAVEHSHPPWMLARWRERLGLDHCRSLAQANNEPALPTLRVNTLRVTREEQARVLREAGIAVRPTAHAPDGLVLETPAGAVDRLPGYGEGWFWIQDEASQLACGLLDPQPGESILDACAAPGGKTAHLIALSGGKARVTAFDLNPSRLLTLRENLARLAMPEIPTRALDASKPPGKKEALFDKVLVDAPCSSTGVIRRHPDIKWRRLTEEIARSALGQAVLLAGVARRVRVGGRMLYGVCSLEPEEGPEVVADFLAAHAHWRLLPVTGVFREEPGYFRVWPDQHGMDGFFGALMERTA